MTTTGADAGTNRRRSVLAGVVAVVVVATFNLAGLGLLWWLATNITWLFYIPLAIAAVMAAAIITATAKAAMNR